MKLRLTLLLVVTAIMTFAIEGEATRLADGDLTLTQRQIADSLRLMLRNDPAFRTSFVIHQRFMDLYDRMPTFERASFGPTVRTVYWRSVKWSIQWIYESTNRTHYVGLSYGPGPGLDYFQTSRLVDGHYVGQEQVDMAAALADRLPRRPKWEVDVRCASIRGWWADGDESGALGRQRRSFCAARNRRRLLPVCSAESRRTRASRRRRSFQA